MDDPVQMIAVVRGASSAYCRSQEPSEPIIPRSLLLRCHRAVSLSRQKPGIAATTSAGSNLGRETAESLIATIAIDPRRCGRGDRIGAEGLQQIQGRANSFPTERWRPYIWSVRLEDGLELWRRRRTARPLHLLRPHIHRCPSA